MDLVNAKCPIFCSFYKEDNPLTMDVHTGLCTSPNCHDPESNMQDSTGPNSNHWNISLMAPKNLVLPVHSNEQTRSSQQARYGVSGQPVVYQPSETQAHNLEVDGPLLMSKVLSEALVNTLCHFRGLSNCVYSQIRRLSKS